MVFVYGNLCSFFLGHSSNTWIIIIIVVVVFVVVVVVIGLFYIILENLFLFIIWFCRIKFITQA
jgi:hypothetical protein